MTEFDFNDYDTNFSSSWLPSSELFDSQQSRPFLETPVTPSHQEAQQQTNTSGRRTQESPTLSLSLAPWLSSETPNQIGTKSGTTPSVESSKKSRPTCESIPTTHSVGSPKTIWWPNQWSGQSMSSGEKRALGKVGELGTKRLSQLTRRFHQRNSGMGTMDTNMWSSMNLPGKLESSTCSDGAIDTPLPWKPRGLQLSSTPKKSGLPPTWTQENGTPTRRNPKRKLSFDDL